MFKPLIRIFLLGFGALIASGVSLTAQQGLRLYSVTDLGTLGGPSSEALGLNNFDDVVGTATTANGESHAFLYRNGGLIDLGTLPGGTASRAVAINDRGDIVGESGVNAYGPQFREFTQGFIWQEGGMRSLGALFCRCSYNVRYGTSRASAVSEGGTIAGDSQTIRGEHFTHAVLWSGETMYDLASSVDGQPLSRAFDISEINEVVGSMNDRAFLTRNGRVEDLGVLPGHASSAARSINNVGQVVGISSSADGFSRAFLWDLGRMRDLGLLPGHASSEANAVSVNGDVVGRSGNPDLSDSRAVLWRGGRAIDLNTLITPGSGWTLSNATAINDLQHIVGVGIRNGEARAILLTPR
jgi:probable HAF family extracellular repeat protein